VMITLPRTNRMNPPSSRKVTMASYPAAMALGQRAVEFLPGRAIRMYAGRDKRGPLLRMFTTNGR